MRRVFTLSTILVFAACGGVDYDQFETEQSSSELGGFGCVLDTNNDGRPDTIDLDCDGEVDAPPSVPSSPVCTPQRVDEDGDGQFDGVDLDCDGVVDESSAQEPPQDKEAQEESSEPETEPEQRDPADYGEPTEGEDEIADEGDDEGGNEGSGDDEPEEGGLTSFPLGGAEDTGEGEMESSEDEAPEVCLPLKIDENQDGFVDGIDRDCDGVIDEYFE